MRPRRFWDELEHLCADLDECHPCRSEWSRVFVLLPAPFPARLAEVGLLAWELFPPSPSRSLLPRERGAGPAFGSVEVDEIARLIVELSPPDLWTRPMLDRTRLASGLPPDPFSELVEEHP